MCTGLEIAAISAAVGAGGSYMSKKQEADNAQDKINARNGQVAQEQARQKIFQDNNDATINQTLQDFSQEKQQQQFGDLVAKREEAYSANAPASSEFANISDTTPTVVKADLTKRVADGVAKSKASAKALARMGGTTDVFQKNGLGINQAANQIGTQNNMAKGSLNTNLAEQTAAANNAGNGSSTFGDLLQGAGAMGVAAYGPGALQGASAGTAAQKAKVLAPMGPFGADTPWMNTPNRGF